MRRMLIIGYLVMSFMSAVWLDAMDKQYTVQSNVTGWVATTFVALTWPITIPAIMASIAIGHCGRWELTAKCNAQS